MTPKPWKTLSRSTVLDYDKWLTVESHTIELPNGEILEDWAWVITPDFVNVVAVTEDNRFILFRQTKYCVIGKGDRLLFGFIGHHGHDRAKCFVVHHFHVMCRARNHGRT